MGIHPRAALAAIALVVGLLAPLSAVAQPDVSGSIVINEPNGFPGVCTQPCFTIEKAFEVYLDGNLTGPGVCPVGSNTYLYTLTHLGGMGPFIPALTLFEVGVANAAVNVISAGFIPGAGVPPSATTINVVNDVVEWDFLAPLLQSGQTSDQLFVCSPLLPGTVNDNAVSTDGQAGLDAPGTCVGPFVEAQACNLEIDKTCCVPPPPMPGFDICEGKVRRAVFEYTADDCSATSNDQGKKAKCSGDPVGGPADITVLKKANEITVSPANGIAIGGTVQFSSNPAGGDLPSNLKLKVEGSGGDQTLQIHTSCSKALRCDDVFGSLKLVELETTEGGTVVCGPPDPSQSQCETTTIPGAGCDDKLVEIKLEYNGSDCQNPLPNPQGGDAECDGDATGATNVNVIYTGRGANAGGHTVSPASLINDGDLVTVTATGIDQLTNQLKLLITDANGTLQKVFIHTSCSQPLSPGDVFGSFRVVEFTETDGEVKSEPGGGGGSTFDACEVPLAPPSPHCTSKVNALTLVYIGDWLGEGCTVSNGQDGKASCTGVDDPGDPVSVTITKDVGTVEASPSSGINLFGFVTIEKNDGSQLSSSTEFDVTGPGGTQSIELHTSCSQPLNLADRFGSFAVFSIDRKDDGIVGLGGQIEYQYTVTNPNASSATNVTITDDTLGQIATGLTILAGESETVVQQATLFETTTNQATVMGEVNGDACEVASDEVTTTVLLPPPGAFDCSDAKPIDQLSMTWNGTEGVFVKAWDGDVGSTLLWYTYTDGEGDLRKIDPGETLTVSGMGGSPNDQVWEIFRGDYTMQKLGESKFHISCSDDDMNGVEDCTSPQGDGKNDDPEFLNDWLFEGMKGDDGTLVCAPSAVPPLPACGLGVELMFLMPGLIWLRNRRARRKQL